MTKNKELTKFYITTLKHCITYQEVKILSGNKSKFYSREIYNSILMTKKIPFIFSYY